MSTDELADTLATGTIRVSQSLAGYELGEELGHGGMGDVILARDPKMGRDVALKRMRLDHPPPEAIERFLREAKIQARLDHPAIVPVHDLGIDEGGMPYFTMKRLTGTTLAALLADHTAPAQPQRLLRTFVDVCQAIDLAHAKKIVHRDLKPANIMLGDYGEVYVIDWGVARVLTDAAEPTGMAEIPSLDGQTQIGQLLGTPGYMSPEQVRGEPVGTPADIYALDSILFELLAGAPLHARGVGALTSTLEGAADPSPARRVPGRAVAPELDAACIAALAEDPAKRPTARALATAIQAYLDGDRDLEGRRALAVEQVALARAALARDDRATAVHTAGRALALDPSSTEASELLTGMLVEPPDPLPAEVAAAVDGEEARMVRERSKRAILPFIGLPLILLPFLPWLDLASWQLLTALIAVGLVLSGISYVNWKVRPVPIGVFMLVQLGFITLFSRLTSAFVITPMLIAGVLLAITSVPWVNDRRWVVLVWALLATTLPLVLESIGVFDATWRMTADGLVTHSTIIRPHAWPDALLYVIGNVAITLTVGLYALNFARDRRAAQRAIHVHAWHLQQLLPRRRVL